MSIEFIGKTKKSDYYFRNEKYYFILQERWIRKGWSVKMEFAVTEYREHPKNLLDIFNKGKVIRISGEEINEQIKIIRKEFPELLL